MPNKRALIVDDSRSARHILGRMLESFALEVDAVESAELALTYLQTTRPDVIFMDHLMPGMDGFAAVRVIKANPDTATIPVLMYTSQEGEMYLSQARALGAMGVLPKTLKHADVADALQHLGLHTPIVAAARPPMPVAEREVTMRDAAPREPAPVEVLNSPAEEAVPDLVSALSMSPSAAPQWAHRIATEVHAEFQRRGSELNISDNARGWRITSAVTSALALLLLLMVIYQQVQIQQQLLQLQNAGHAAASNVFTSAPTDATTMAESAAPEITSAAAIESAPRKLNNATPTVETEAVPYGEVPLSGERLDHLRTLLEKMHEARLRGMVRVEVFLGDFCLSGNSANGYMPADDELLISKCDLTGNPFGDALTVQQRQSVAFANLVSSTNSNAVAGIKVQLVDGAHRPAVPYPTPAATLSAGAWNRIAERNQRVEFMVLPAP